MFGKRKPATLSLRGLVTGKVQSVAFRFFTRQEATQLGLAGWVKNLDDGRVAFHVHGPRTEVEEFLAWLRVGPPRARVDELEQEPCAPEELSEFEIH